MSRRWCHRIVEICDKEAHRSWRVWHQREGFLLSFNQCTYDMTGAILTQSDTTFFQNSWKLQFTRDRKTGRENEEQKSKNILNQILTHKHSHSWTSETSERSHYNNGSDENKNLRKNRMWNSLTHFFLFQIDAHLHSLRKRSKKKYTFHLWVTRILSILNRCITSLLTKRTGRNQEAERRKESEWE